MKLDGEKGRGSTTWSRERGRLTSSAAGKRQPAKRSYRWFGLVPMPRGGKVTITVKYRGGAEAWYVVEARGRSGVFPGHAYLHDVMDEISQLR